MRTIFKTLSLICVSLILLSGIRVSAALSASDAEYLEHLATAVEELEHNSTESAAQAVVAAMEHRRDEGLAHLARGVVLLHSGMFAEADEAFINAGKMKAPLEICLYGRAASRLGLGEIAAASALLPRPSASVPTYEINLFRAYLDAMQTGAVPTLNPDDPRKKQFEAFAALAEGSASEKSKALEAMPSVPNDTAAIDTGLCMTFDRYNPVLAASASPAAITVLGNPGAQTAGFSGRLRLRADAARTPGANIFTFLVNGRMIGVVNNPPDEILWDTSSVANGVHTVTIRGETSSGYVVGESSQEVIIANSSPEPGIQLTGPAADKVEKALAKSIFLRPSLTWAQYQQGLLYEAAGEKTKALTCYARVLAAQPGFRDTQTRWQKLASLKGRPPVWKGSGSDKSVALTFDDGPNSGTQSLLDALKSTGVKATFFIVGSQARKNRDLLKAIAADGHLIGCHSETHRGMTQLTDTEMIRELFGPIAIVLELTGKLPQYFRPPGGHFDARARNIAESFGLIPVMWSENCGPYEGGPPVKIEQYVASSSRSGSVVLMHNCEPSTLKALPGVVRQLQNKGLRIVTVEQMQL